MTCAVRIIRERGAREISVICAAVMVSRARAYSDPRGYGAWVLAGVVLHLAGQR